MKGNRIKMSLLVFLSLGDILILSQEIAYLSNMKYIFSTQVSSTSFDLKSIYWDILKELIYFIICVKRRLNEKIVVASDSFKGSVSSIEVAECAELAIHKVFPDCEVVKIPVGDGGEGTVETLITAMGGEAVSCVVHDPLMRSVEATYGILGDNRTAVIEMATASGLTLVPVSERNPLRTTTYGTGELIKDAMDRGCRDFLIGIGGSATNDGGTGMLQALGFRFLDRNGNELGLGWADP